MSINGYGQQSKSVSSIAINPTTKIMHIGESFTFTPTITPSDADNKNVTFNSSNTQVAFIFGTGRTIANKVGTTTISVTSQDGNFSDTAILTVIDTTKPIIVTSCPAPFEEQNNIISVDIESVSPSNGWSKKTEVAGYTDESYYEWLGGNRFNSPGSGILEYKINIRTAGTYHFLWRSKVGKGTNSTEHNDSWLKITGVKDFYGKKGNGNIVHPKGVCSGDCPAGSGGNGYFKVYLSGTSNWTWSTRTSDHDPHEIYIDVDQPGIITVLISGRSDNHLLDKFVLYNTSKTTKVKATNLTLQETNCIVTSINDTEINTKLRFFPNPAVHEIKFTKEVEKVRITNQAGIEMSTEYNVSRMRISQLKPGVYFVAMLNKAQSNLEKLIVK